MKIGREFIEWKRAFLRAIPGHIGERLRRRLYGFHCDRSSRVLSNVVVYHPEKLRIGKNTGIASSCHINASGDVTIGDGVLIGPGTYIWSQNHNFEDQERTIRSQGYSYASVVIENDVWIAARCVILPGVTIAKGSVVAAGAVVTQSTEMYSIVAGVPARRVGGRVNSASNQVPSIET